VYVERESAGRKFGRASTQDQSATHEAASEQHFYGSPLNLQLGDTHKISCFGKVGNNGEVAGGRISVSDTVVNAVPEPSTLLTLGLGLMAPAGLRRDRSNYADFKTSATQITPVTPYNSSFI